VTTLIKENEKLKHELAKAQQKHYLKTPNQFKGYRASADQYKGCEAAGNDCYKVQSNLKKIHAQVVKKTFKGKAYQTVSKESSNKQPICWYFLNAKCKFGFNCRNRHIKEELRNEKHRELNESKSLPIGINESHRENEKMHRKVENEEAVKTATVTEDERLMEPKQSADMKVKNAEGETWQENMIEVDTAGVEGNDKEMEPEQRQGVTRDN